MIKKILFTLLLTSFALSAQTSLIPNHDFEDWDSFDTNPDEWSRFLDGFWEISDDAQSGDSSLSLEIAEGRTFNFIFSDDIPLDMGTTYECSLNSKVSSGDFTEVQFRLVDTSGTFGETVETFSITEFSSTEWLEAKFSYENTSYSSLAVYIYVYGSEGNKILLDNVILTEQTSLSTNNFDTDLTSLNVFPNPVSSQEELKFNDEIDVVLYNLQGKKIIEKKKTKNLQLNGIKSGIYFLKSNLNNSIKVIVE